MTRPDTPAMPLLLSEAICAPDRLTSAELISKPEVRSALSLADSTARATPSRLTTPPLRIPSDGTMPTPMMRRRDSSSSWPTSAQIFVVPTSTPTKMISSEPIMSLRRSFLPIVGGGRVLHADHLRGDAPLHQHLRDLPVQLHFEDHIPAAAEIRLPALGVNEAETVLGVVVESIHFRYLGEQGGRRPQCLGLDHRRQ